MPIIKSSESEQRISMFAGGGSPLGIHHGSPEVELSEGDLAVQGLKAELEHLKQKLTEQEKGFARDLDEARADAAAQVIADYERSEKDGLAILEKTLCVAQNALMDKLQVVDIAALAVAQAAIDALFAGVDTGRLVEASIQRQCQGLKRDFVLSVRVSAEDFSNAEDVSAASLGDGSKEAQVSIDDTLGSGQAYIDLKLGHIEISLQRDWKTLCGLFEKSAEDYLVP